jgi:cobalamin biosynthesis protein CobT
MEAFSEESAALRRALGVNWERRYKGRYRSGKRVGMANLRRFVMEEDLRLFQRLQVPDSLSYYFHLVVDTSYSMLEQHNAEKAFAIAYAFTELLHEYRVPVDVTLYSSGVTDLYDHQRDTLEPFFGREFGYLVSGTLEMEAVAYAKAKADRVQERRKIIVVITDGTPSAITLPHVGSPDMTTYYRETFIPWLREAGIELMAIGIGLEPSYHERAVTLSESWEAIPVLIELLEEIVREGEQRVQALWV